MAFMMPAQNICPVRVLGKKQQGRDGKTDRVTAAAIAAHSPDLGLDAAVGCCIDKRQAKRSTAATRTWRRVHQPTPNFVHSFWGKLLGAAYQAALDGKVGRCKPPGRGVAHFRQ